MEGSKFLLCVAKYEGVSESEERGPCPQYGRVFLERGDLEEESSVTVNVS